MVDFTNQWGNLLNARYVDAFILSKGDALFVRYEFPTFFDERFDLLSNCVIIPGSWVTLTIDECEDKSRQQILYNYFSRRLMRRNVRCVSDIYMYDNFDMFKAIYGNGLVSLCQSQNSTLQHLPWYGFYVPKMPKVGLTRYR